MPFDRATRVFLQMCSCSARSTWCWCIIAGCFVGGYPISLVDGTIWTDCEYSYHRRRPYISVLCLLQAARDLRETLAPGTGRPGPIRKQRRIQGRKHRTRVREEPVCEQSALAVVQDVRGLAGALVYNCRPSLLPVSIPLQDFRRSLVDDFEMGEMGVPGPVLPPFRQD